MSTNGAVNGAPTTEDPGGITIPALGGWMAGIPGPHNPLWVAAQIAGAIPGVTVETPATPVETFIEEEKEQLISEAGDIVTAAVVTGVIVGGVLFVGAVIAGIAYVKMS